MPNDTRPRDPGTRFPDAHAPPYRGGLVHHHDHCGVRCPYCGPDSLAWALGETVVATVIALATAVVWLLRHPAVTLALLVVGFIGWTAVTG